MDCPTCGKSLSSERGMRQHHTKVHGEPLPNRTCSGCGTGFYDPKARLKFCDECDPNTGKRNGNWQDATERAVCEECGDEFEYYPSNKKGVYCPECVAEADEFLGDHYAEVHDIERIERDCHECGDQFSVLPCQLRQRKAKFCSHRCLSSWMSEGSIDRTTIYSGDWHSVKRQALERDNHQCQYCDANRSQIGREPDIHHLIPVREFDDPQEAHTLDNVVALCRSCHRYAEIGEIPVSEFRPEGP